MNWLHHLECWLRVLLDTNWAYLVLFVWTMLEGETCLILAGAFSTDGTPNIFLCILSGFAGSLTGDQIGFLIGRVKGRGLLEHRPFWKRKAEKVFALLERHSTWLLLGFRFLYGLRNVTPFAIGMSNVPVRRFVTFNIIGAAAWAATFGSLGYLFGTAMETYLEQPRHRVGVIVAVAAVIFVVWLARAIFSAVKNRKSAAGAGQDKGGRL